MRVSLDDVKRKEGRLVMHHELARWATNDVIIFKAWERSSSPPFSSRVFQTFQVQHWWLYRCASVQHLPTCRRPSQPSLETIRLVQLLRHSQRINSWLESVAFFFITASHMPLCYPVSSVTDRQLLDSSLDDASHRKQRSSLFIRI